MWPGWDPGCHRDHQVHSYISGWGTGDPYKASFTTVPRRGVTQCVCIYIYIYLQYLNTLKKTFHLEKRVSFCQGRFFRYLNSSPFLLFTLFSLQRSARCLARSDEEDCIASTVATRFPLVDDPMCSMGVPWVPTCWKTKTSKTKRKTHKNNNHHKNDIQFGWVFFLSLLENHLCHISSIFKKSTCERSITFFRTRLESASFLGKAALRGILLSANKPYNEFSDSNAILPDGKMHGRGDVGLVMVGGLEKLRVSWFLVAVQVGLDGGKMGIAGKWWKDLSSSWPWTLVIGSFFWGSTTWRKIS